ncbi:sulfotransferase family 2 domain-containing protein [Ectothiorhodospiraceae bacterium WFHF3C12]|nr:sulfotransferase family 2 domain-containing protein [Ectothiorhodospiraceae bacterium WFHF3C12]
MFRRSRFPAYVRTPSRPEGRRLAQARPEVVFHHQPKTAGSSFRQLLGSYFQKQEICPCEIDAEVHALRGDLRQQYRFYAGHYQYDTVADYFPDAIWLTFLRNPVDRLVSNFYNLRDQTRHPEAWKSRAEARPAVRKFLEKVSSMELSDFVFSDEPRALDRVVNRQTRYLVRRTKLVKGFPRYDEALVSEAKEHLERNFSFVGLQEEYDRSLRLLFLTFGLAPPKSIDSYTTNVNTREKTEGGYEVESQVRDYLIEVNQMDLAIWEYARELLRDREALYERFADARFLRQLTRRGLGRLAGS